MSRWRTAGLLAAALACGRAPATAVTAERIADPADLGLPGDRFELVPALRLPLDADHRQRTRIVLTLPAGSKLTSAGGPAPSVQLPPGANLDRVESVESAPGVWVVADVRGTRVTADGQRFHAFRPERPGPGAPLFGESWPARDAEAQEAAGGEIAAAMRRGVGFAEALRPADRPAAISHYLGLSSCLACHEAHRPAQRLASSGEVWRPTDANGWYSLLSTLRDEAPLQAYRPDDPNVDDPFVAISCARGGPAIVSAGGGRHASCPSGDVPEGRLDVRGGLAARDPHVLALCESRRALWSRFDAAGRAAFREAFHECGLDPSKEMP
ncbi:MAG TPA: hypothetical protein VMB50_02315 [Myxococcales bacterium]|nr:hypothetical protein [Myxococcales bacterium]